MRPRPSSSGSIDRRAARAELAIENRRSRDAAAASRTISASTTTARSPRRSPEAQAATAVGSDCEIASSRCAGTRSVTSDAADRRRRPADRRTPAAGRRPSTSTPESPSSTPASARTALASGRCRRADEPIGRHLQLARAAFPSARSASDPANTNGASVPARTSRRNAPAPSRPPIRRRRRDRRRR